jgi:uncharacterized membrane protein
MRLGRSKRVKYTLFALLIVSLVVAWLVDVVAVQIAAIAVACTDILLLFIWLDWFDRPTSEDEK